MTDNRTNEPSHNRITIRAFRDGEVSIIHEDQVLGLACTLDELKRAVATYEARGALEAADRPAGTFTEAQVEAAAEAIHNLMQGDPSFKDSGRKREMRIYARAALVAAQGAARPVNGFDTTVERVKNGADSLHVAPQEPSRVNNANGHSWMTWDESGKNGTYCRSCGGWAGKVGNRQCSPAPVLPSSGVDEGALAEELESCLEAGSFDNGDTSEPIWFTDDVKALAAHLAEWLKGQGGESSGE